MDLAAAKGGRRTWCDLAHGRDWCKEIMGVHRSGLMEGVLGWGELPRRCRRSSGQWWVAQGCRGAVGAGRRRAVLEEAGRPGEGRLGMVSACW